MSDLPPPLPGSEAGSTPVPQSMGYASATLVDRDAEHLKVLSICWYVVAGLNALFGCFPLIYVVMGVVFMVGGTVTRPGEPPAAVMGAVFASIGGVLSILIWVGALMSFLTARAMKNRNRIVLCYVTAGLACLNVPIGTILGVFTFVVLSRPTVRSQFA